LIHIISVPSTINIKSLVLQNDQNQYKFHDHVFTKQNEVKISPDSLLRLLRNTEKEILDLN